MNKRIAYLILGLAVVGGLSACTKQLVEEAPLPKNTHTVYFSSSAAQTKTGISIKDQVVTPNWQGTTAANSHLFEYDANDAVSVGEAVEINIDDNDNTIAHFIADFPSEWLIVADPSGEEEGSGVSSGSTATPPFTYAAIIAQQVEGELEFVVPAEQQPQTNTLIDPTADFLIGYSRKAYDDPHNFDEQVVNLWFDRPVVLGRFALTNLGAGEKVKSVTVSSTEGMTGSTTLDKIDFENAAVNNFTRKTDDLVLSYGDGVAAEGATFFAYFVTLPGTVHITEIKVETDAHLYTKTIDGGKEFTFSNTAFKNIGLDLSSFTIGDVTPTNHTWYKASKLEAGYDYIIVSEGQALKNNGSGKVVAAQPVEVVNNTISPDNTEGIIWRATDVVADLADYGTHTLKNGEEMLWRYSNSNTYRVQATSDADTISEKAKYLVWNYDGEYFWNISIYNTTVSQYYVYYSDGWKTSTTKTVATLFTTRAPQTLSFTPKASAEYDLYSEKWTVEVPTLNGVQTSASYALSEDSNPTVATVDSDGTVHPLSTGTVTIVATAAGNAEFQTASASYTLTIVNSDPNVNVYRKVTGTADLEMGAQYLLVFEGLPENSKEQNHNPKVFRPTLASGGSTFNKQTTDALAVEIVNGTISSNDYASECHFTLEEGYYLKADAVNKYIYPSGSSSGSGTLSAESSSTNSLNITFNNGIVQIKAKSGTNYLVWSTSSYYFSSNANVEGDYSTGICLYKLDDDREAWAMSYSPAEAEYDLYTKAWTPRAPSLTSNATTTVSYTSSNTNVATVDDSGVVTPIKKGSATITATAAADATHKKTEASFELTVDDTTPVEMVSVQLKKATSLTAGKKYVLVSNGMALLKNGDEAGAVAFNSADLTVSVPSSSRNDVEWTLVKKSGTITRGNEYAFTIGDYFFGIAMNTNVQTYTYTVEVNNGREVSSGISIQDHNVNLANDLIYYAGNSSNYYIYYDGTSWNNGKVGNSLTPDASYKTALYVVDDGNTPGSGDDPVTGKRFIKASTIENGESYLIVSNGKALRNNKKTAAAVDVTPSGGIISVEGISTDMIWMATEEDGMFNFTNEGSYLQRSSGRVTIADKNGTAYNNKWSYNDSKEQITINGSGTSVYVIHYGSSWSLTAIASADSYTSTIYKLVEE